MLEVVECCCDIHGYHCVYLGADGIFDAVDICPYCLERKGHFDWIPDRAVSVCKECGVEITNTEAATHNAVVKHVCSKRTDETKEEKMIDEKVVENNFRYHQTKGDQLERYARIRSEGLGLARMILRDCPDSAERTLAIRSLDVAIMQANAAIARNE